MINDIPDKKIRVSEVIISELEQISDILERQFKTLNNDFRENIACSDLINNERKNNYLSLLCDENIDLRYKKLSKIVQMLKA